jgi:hypothetical protein
MAASPVCRCSTTPVSDAAGVRFHEDRRLMVDEGALIEEIVF